MNRAERRRLEKQQKKKEPVYMVKPSEIGRAAAQIGEAAMMHEINQQILKMDKQFQLDSDARVLWALKQFTGWGPKKMKEFYLLMFKEHLRMRKFYEMEDTYPERYKLKEKGIDVEAWYNELFDGESNYRNQNLDQEGEK